VELIKRAITFLLVFLVLSSSLVPYLPLSSVSSQTSPGAEIVGMSSEAGSLPAQARRGSIIQVKVLIKNMEEEARTFFVGASIIGEGETTWKNLPGWGATAIISPGAIREFEFGEYSIPSNAYQGYHGIVVKVWADSSRTRQFAERWFQRALIVGSRPQSCVALSFDFESDSESYKSTGYVRESTLQTMEDIIDLLVQQQITATLFIQGACLDNPESKDDVRNIINAAHSEGLEIASHSYSHPSNINGLSESEIEWELSKTEDLLLELTGTLPIGFRAPYFAYGDRLWNVLAVREYLYDSSVWQYEPVVYSVSTSSGSIIEVPWKHQDGDTAYSDLIDSLNYAASYGKTRVIDFHPQTVNSHWTEFKQFIDLVSDLKIENRIDVCSLSQLAKVSPRTWDDDDSDSIPNYLDRAEFSVSSMRASVNLFNLEWSVGVYVITPAIDRANMLAALYEEGVEDLSPYENIVPVVIDLKFPFVDVNRFLEWLSSFGIIGYDSISQIRAYLESLLSTDEHLRISLILKWNTYSDWKIDSYVIRDLSPPFWGLFLVELLIATPEIMSFTAHAYQSLVKGVPLSWQDIAAEAVWSATTLILKHSTLAVWNFQFASWIWIVGAAKGLHELMEAIEDPRLDLHLYDSSGRHLLGVDYEKGVNITTCEHGIYFGPSTLNQYMIVSREGAPYTLSVSNRLSGEIQYFLYGRDLLTNQTVFSTGILAQNKSSESRVYLYQNKLRTTQIFMSASLSETSIFRNEEARLTIHISNENGTSVSDASVLVQINDRVYEVSILGEGFYESSIEGSKLASGNYTIEIIANKTGMMQDVEKLTLTVNDIPSQIPLHYLLLTITIIAVSIISLAVIWRKKRKP
jgi:peptidoglycan/xylan/chitin deacetylase (PgdA/CDA1 family)